MRADEFFGIDVTAELATLCGAQLQGPWQVPAEFVRLACARGASRIDVVQRRGGFSIRCDGAVATSDELDDLISVFDRSGSAPARQRAISRIESNGGSALLWAVGFPRSRLWLECRAGDTVLRFRARRGRMEKTTASVEPAAPSTALRWRCGGLNARRAATWLRTALRFVPIPVTIDGRPVERGFPEGLYRMRISEPLPSELAITVGGDVPTLWLLDHGVLSTRAVVPGYPAFSAAVEMHGVVSGGASADELRAAATPYLQEFIDQAVGMLLLLVDRLPSVDEPVRRRLVILLLRSAILGIRGDQVLAASIVPIRSGAARWMETPAGVARLARRRNGVLAAIEPGARAPAASQGPVVEVSTEEGALLSELLDLRLERKSGVAQATSAGLRLHGLFRSVWAQLCGLAGPAPLTSPQLREGESSIVAAAADVGIGLEFCNGAGGVRRRGARFLLARNRPEVQDAVRSYESGEAWLYPALLVLLDGQIEIPEDTRTRWLDAVLDDGRLEIEVES